MKTGCLFGESYCFWIGFSRRKHKSSYKKDIEVARGRICVDDNVVIQNAMIS